MGWIESHTVLIRHRKLKNLARELRLRPSHTMGHLHALWHAALEQQESGDLSSWTDEFIAESSDYPGDAPQYVRLLQKTGWLDGKILHDWLDYAGRYLNSKYRTSDPNLLKSIVGKHSRTKDGLKTDFSPPTNLTLPDPPNQTLPSSKKSARSFSRPTPQEVTEYSKAIGFDLEGGSFCDFYESKGWLIGKSPMRSWQAAVRTWKKNNYSKGGLNGRSGTIIGLDKKRYGDDPYGDKKLTGTT